MAGPRIPDVTQLIRMGVDPVTGLPIKAVSGVPQQLKEDIRKSLRIQDEQQAINRYTWYNLPSSLDGQLVERMLYYRGQLAFFYIEATNKFYLLPYSLSGEIDVYGRYTGITPLQFAGGSKNDKVWIKDFVKKPIYELGEIDTDEDMIDAIKNGCVLLYDYSKQLGEQIIPRQIINEPIIDFESELFPFARTAAVASSGVKGLRVSDEDQSANVKAMSRAISHAALTGDYYVPVIGNVEFQELAEGNGGLKSQEYLLLMQAVDNYRLGLYGLNAGGVMEKKAHELQSEADQNVSNAQLSYQDGLTIRQKFCDMVNAIWGIGIWCDSSETAMGIDRDGDGEAADKQDQSGVAGEQPQEGMNDAE